MIITTATRATQALRRPGPGDSLFPGGVGATFGDAKAFAQLVDEVETKVFGTLGDDTWFYPGHVDDGGARRRAAAPPGVARARLVTIFLLGR